MAVRNFWIEASIDGRKTKLEGGPRAKDGGFELTVYMRSDGGIVRAYRVSGFANSETGMLELVANTTGDAERNLAIETWDVGNLIRLEAER